MIYTPFSVVGVMLSEFRERGTILNPSVCTKIEFKGHEISVAMDSSLKFGNNLARTDIRVYRENKDVSSEFFQEDETMLYGDAETLLRVMNQINQKG